MPFSRTRASKITGASIDLYRKAEEWIAEANIEGQTVTCKSTDRHTALALLVEEAYRIRCKLVMIRAAGKCENCGKFGPGSVHHKILRSQGRDDTLSNLEFLCNEDHERRHGMRQRIRSWRKD